MSFYSNIENPEEKENYNFINIEKNIIKPNEKIYDSFSNVPQSNSQFQIIMNLLIKIILFQIIKKQTVSKIKKNYVMNLII